MTVEMINEFIDSMVRGTLTGICFAFWLLCMAGIWKWFIGVMKRALFYLFPGLKAWVENRRKVREKDNGNDNDTEPSIKKKLAERKERKAKALEDSSPEQPE